MASGYRAIHYPMAFTLAAIVGVAVMKPWTYARTYVFTSGSDFVWQQAVFQMHAQVGVFGSTPHIAWPVGADPWRLPQLGSLVGAWANLTVGWFDVGTATSIGWFLVFVAALNSVAILFLLRSLVGTRLPALAQVLAVTLGASLFTFTHQLNLAALFPIPLVLGVLVRAHRFRRRQLSGAAGCLAGVALLAPMWWIVVLLLMLPFMAVASVLRRRWMALGHLVVVWAALFFGFAVQVLAFVLAAREGPGADTSRQPWSSNYFPGTTASLMVSSPWVDELLPGLTGSLRPGAGVFTAVGLPMALAAALAFVIVIALPPRRSKSDADVLVLGSATVVAVLFWLGGGLGNFQAALAVIGGTISPARVWYRMTVVMAVLGAGWLMTLWSALPERDGTRRWRYSIAGSMLVAGVMLAGGVGDLVSYDTQFAYPDADEPQPALPGVAFLSSSLDPCPVAQFPNEGVPVARIPGGIADPRLYQGWVPYVIEPDFFWSAGVYDPTESPRGLALMPVVLDGEAFDQLRVDGYCAMLFDKSVSAQAVEASIEIEGRELGSVPTPDFEDDRFSVFLLE